MRDVRPRDPVVAGPVNTCQVFFVLIIQWTAYTEIVMSRQQTAVREPDDARAAEICLRFGILKFDFVELHRYIPFSMLQTYSVTTVRRLTLCRNIRDKERNRHLTKSSELV